MLYFLLSLVVVLQDTVNTQTVSEKSLDQMYKDLKNNQSSCSLLDQNTEDHFQKLCKDRKSPEAEIDQDNIDQFEFDFLPYLCYTVLHNLRSACSHSQQDFIKFSPQSDPSQFCKKPAQINITENCTAWLEDQDKAHSDCALLSKVVGVILSNKTCHDYCIKEDRIDPLCQDLVRSSVILAALSNRSQPTAPLTPPGLTKGSVTTAHQKQEDLEKKTEKKDENEKNEETKEETMTSTASTISSPQIVQTETKAKKEKEEKEIVKEEDLKKDNKVEEKSVVPAAAEEEEIESIEAKHTDSLAVPETNHPKEKIEAEVEKVSEPEEQKTSGVISGDTISVTQSNFFSYFIMLSIVAILAYLVFHNKQKVSEALKVNNANGHNVTTYISTDIGPHIRGPEKPRKQEEVWWQRVQKTGQQSGGETEMVRVIICIIILFTGHHGDGKRGQS